MVSNLLCIKKSTGRKAIIISWLSLQVYFEMDFPQVWNSGSMVMSSYVLIHSFYVLHCFATGSTCIFHEVFERISYVSVSTVLMHVAFEIGVERHLERVLGRRGGGGRG
jgi:hypothetical protein